MALFLAVNAEHIAACLFYRWWPLHTAVNSPKKVSGLLLLLNVFNNLLPNKCYPPASSVHSGKARHVEQAGVYAGTQRHTGREHSTPLRWTHKLQVFHMDTREALPQYKIKAFSTVMSTAAKLWARLLQLQCDHKQTGFLLSQHAGETLSHSDVNGKNVYVAPKQQPVPAAPGKATHNIAAVSAPRRHQHHLLLQEAKHFALLSTLLQVPASGAA